MMELFLQIVPLGQTPIPVGDPTGGWASLFLQSGCFGLIVYIVAFMFPRSQKEACAERERRDTLFCKMLETNNDKFEARNIALIAATKEQTRLLVEEMHANTAQIAKQADDAYQKMAAIIANTCKAARV